MYMMAKHLHLTAVVLSILLFILRFIWSQFDASILQKKWVKVLPHIIDTVLLASAIWLCIILSQYPFVQSWLTFKVLGVIAYILLGLVALKWAKSTPGRWIGFVAALAVLTATAMVAVTKQPLF
ncbi:SirB2 family protein [Alteromonas halophila]|uniref:SirB family protein n=1 Tax=Alteromonas halophila TaxID=516698 RepID=A0A918JDR9_9ALTE|nr:SirB2 family protein [Alteromonas halophila]GGW76011.1 SirB family protein [Alteromonas halophila]